MSEIAAFAQFLLIGSVILIAAGALVLAIL